LFKSVGGRGIDVDDTPSGKWSILSIFITILKFDREITTFITYIHVD